MVNKTRIQSVSWQSYTAVIPKWIIRKFNLRKGDSLEWSVKDGQIIATPKMNHTIKELTEGKARDAVT